VLALVHPYILLPLYVSLGLYGLYLWHRQGRLMIRRMAWLATTSVLALPVVVYSYLAISSSPVFRAWQAQNLTLSPPPLHYVLGYGLVLILAILGGIAVVKRRDDTVWPLMIWPLAVTPMLYAPIVFNVQRRMVEGVHVPLVILAALGCELIVVPVAVRSRLAGWLSRWAYPRMRFGRLVEGLVVGLATPSTWYLLASLSLATLGGHGPLFHSRAEVGAVLWLGENSSPNETVLSSYELGGYIPARIGHRVFWGHWTESINLAEKRRQVEDFYSASSELDRQSFLISNGIAYVFYGPRERELGGFVLSEVDFLSPACRVEDVVVYRVEGTEDT
jgi:hypothetical protein